MKKKLTINTLAMGNLKQRRKQYAIMIIGIILAMVFSSSTLFFLYSSQETEMAQHYKEYGYQEGLIRVDGNAEEIFQKAYDDGIVTDYGFAHIIGFGYIDGEDEVMGTSIAWLDDNAKRLSNQLLIEGSYPEKENEIVIEQNALLRLGIEAKPGDNITLKVKIQNGAGYFDTVEKTYKLVGIAVDKKNNIQWDYQDNEMLPAAFVAQGTQTEPGGKELLSAYVIGTDDYEEKIWIDEEQYYYNDPFVNIEYYLQNNSIECEAVSSRFYGGFGYSTITSILPGGGYYIVIPIVLIFASCMAIINSFNTNLKERKRQIGLLRAVGATKRQIIRIFGREAFFISLICTPISVLISYGIVRVGISLLNEEAVFAKSLWVLVLCAAVNVAVTMLAAFIPLFFASCITPMQAIRNIEVNRRMKTKKIKTQKQFSVPSHLAKRTAKLYNGGKIAVSVILSVTIAFSCFGFSLLGAVADVYDYSGEDYSLYNMGSYVGGGYINEKLQSGISEAEKRDIEAYPYFSKVISHKEIGAMFEVDEINEYFLSVGTGDIFWDWDNFDGSSESFEDSFFNLNDADYLAYKNSFGGGKDILSAPLHSYDAYAIKEIEKSLTAGKIDYDKLNSGEEIILIAPQTAKFGLQDRGQYGTSVGTYYGDEDISSDVVIGYEGELPYSVGDKIKLSVVEYANEEDYFKDSEKGVYSNYAKKTDNEVTIAAIIHPEAFYEIDDISIHGETFGFLTTHAGMNAFCENARYFELEAFVNDGVEINDDIEEEITAFLQPIVDKYSGDLRSNYAWQREDAERNMQLYIAMVSIIILGFVISGSIVNNALTASIRERKKEIGTLRAVGADIKVLVGSYIRQLFSMFAYGYGIGFGLYIILLIAFYFMDKATGSGKLPFNPWVTIIFSVILFAICSINLWAKIRKEMKNSIVENIREL